MEIPGDYKAALTQLQAVPSGGNSSAQCAEDVRSAMAECTRRMRGVCLMDHYAVLNVSRRSSAKQLKHAYR
jgi:DnaJ-class molecular chaperone